MKCVSVSVHVFNAARRMEVFTFSATTYDIHIGFGFDCENPHDPRSNAGSSTH